MENKGPFSVDKETSEKIMKFWKEHTRSPDIVRKILSRFPEIETQRGIRVEHITVKERKQRFRELRKLGYPIKPYGGMTADEAKQYDWELKKEIRYRYRRIVPSTIEEVDDQNAEQITQIDLFR